MQGQIEGLHIQSIGECLVVIKLHFDEPALLRPSHWPIFPEPIYRNDLLWVRGKQRDFMHIVQWAWSDSLRPVKSEAIISYTAALTLYEIPSKWVAYPVDHKPLFLQLKHIFILQSLCKRTEEKGRIKLVETLDREQAWLRARQTFICFLYS